MALSRCCGVKIDLVKARSAMAETFLFSPFAVLTICIILPSFLLSELEGTANADCEPALGARVQEDLWPYPVGNFLPSSRTIASSMASLRVSHFSLQTRGRKVSFKPSTNLCTCKKSGICSGTLSKISRYWSA